MLIYVRFAVLFRCTPSSLPDALIEGNDGTNPNDPAQLQDITVLLLLSRIRRSSRPQEPFDPAVAETSGYSRQRRRLTLIAGNLWCEKTKNSLNLAVGPI